MSIRTESYTTQVNEDGSITTTEVSTYTPPTKKEQAVAWTAFTGIMLLPFVPVIAIVINDKREARKAKKAKEAELKIVT